MGSWFFASRGFLLAPYGIFLIFLGRPGLFSFILGFLIACTGEALRIWGVGYAGTTTRKSELEAPELITGGPYAHMRHPLYMGNLLMGLGGFVMASGQNSAPINLFLFFVFLVSYAMVYGIIIPHEEEFLAKRFGAEYQAYAQSVPSVIPSLFAYPVQSGNFDWENIRLGEIHTLWPFAAVVVFMGYRLWTLRGD